MIKTDKFNSKGDGIMKKSVKEKVIFRRDYDGWKVVEKVIR